MIVGYVLMFSSLKNYFYYYTKYKKFQSINNSYYIESSYFSDTLTHTEHWTK